MNIEKLLVKCSLGAFVALCLVFLGYCNSNEKKGGIDQLASDLYLDYNVSAEETAEYAVVLLYFRNGGPDAPAIALESGSQVSFDGEPLVVDSARLTGMYYEVQRPLAGFAGAHKIVYKNKQGQTFEQSFQFVPLILKKMPPVLTRKELVLELGKSAGKNPIQVMITDTSFKTVDINEEYPADNGQIMITKQALTKVASGPITLELVKEETQPLTNGKLTLNYTVRRELDLK